MVHRNAAGDPDEHAYPVQPPKPDTVTVSPVAYNADHQELAITSIEDIDRWISENERATTELRRAITRIVTATNRLRALRDEYLNAPAEPAEESSAEQSYDDEHGSDGP